MTSGGWATSTRRQRLPADWPQRRAQRLAIDNHCCVECGAPATDVDHAVRGDNHELDNLRSLCATHHKAKTQAEAQAARGANQAKLQRPKELHPGLIVPDEPR